MAHSPYPGHTPARRPKKGNPSDHGSEYDYPPHRKARAKLRLGHPLVRLESLTLASSTTVPKNRQVVPGPVGFGAQVWEANSDALTGAPLDSLVVVHWLAATLSPLREGWHLHALPHVRVGSLPPPPRDSALRVAHSRMLCVAASGAGGANGLA